MVTYLELGSEPVWGEQVTPANMLELLVKPLRTFYNMGPALIGAPGDNRHLRGRHRSRDWDLTSAYCTNRAYATTDARDKDGHGSWYRAVDVGITGATLRGACKRMDALVRSGGDGGRVAEWFGTIDGTTVVGWFEGHSSSSDSSHLYHLHVGVWTRYANDAGLMNLLYQTITGQVPPGGDDDMAYTTNDKAHLEAIANAADTMLLDTDATTDGQGAVKPFPVKLTALLKGMQADIAELKARPPVAAAPVDPAALKAALMDPEVMAILKQVAFEGAQRAEDE